MTKEEAFELLRAGRAAEWNDYRKRNPAWVPDFVGTDLSLCDLVPNKSFDLSGALLLGTKFALEVDFLTYEGMSVKLDGALIDADTRFPRSFDPIALGARFVNKSEAAGIKSTPSPMVFISYAWADEDVVLAIDQWLRLKRIQTKIDRRDFFAGTRIRDEVIRVMQECTVVIVMYSSSARDRPWTEFERELASDIAMEAKTQGRQPPRIIYVVVDDTPLPSVTERAKLAVVAKGKRFELVCEEIYHAILQLPKEADEIDLNRFRDYVF